MAGGPGTGKTTTVARVLALLEAQAAAAAGQRRRSWRWPHRPARRRHGSRRPFAAAQPTWTSTRRSGSASARSTGTTLHRLLGFNPGNRTRFRHDRLNRLPHDVVVVDETSMVSLSMMARLRGGGPSRRPPDSRGRPRAAGLGRGRRRAGRHRRPGSANLLHGHLGPSTAGRRVRAARPRGGWRSALGHRGRDRRPAPRPPLRWRDRRACRRRSSAVTPTTRMAVLQAGDSNVQWIPTDAGAQAPVDASGRRAHVSRSTAGAP